MTDAEPRRHQLTSGGAIAELSDKSGSKNDHDAWKKELEQLPLEREELTTLHSRGDLGFLAAKILLKGCIDYGNQDQTARNTEASLRSHASSQILQGCISIAESLYNVPQPQQSESQLALNQQQFLQYLLLLHTGIQRSKDRYSIADITEKLLAASEIQDPQIETGLSAKDSEEASQESQQQQKRQRHRSALFPTDLSLDNDIDDLDTRDLATLVMAKLSQLYDDVQILQQNLSLSQVHRDQVLTEGHGITRSKDGSVDVSGNFDEKDSYLPQLRLQFQSMRKTLLHLQADELAELTQAFSSLRVRTSEPSIGILESMFQTALSKCQKYFDATQTTVDLATMQQKLISRGNELYLELEAIQSIMVKAATTEETIKDLEARTARAGDASIQLQHDITANLGSKEQEASAKQTGGDWSVNSLVVREKLEKQAEEIAGKFKKINEWTKEIRQWFDEAERISQWIETRLRTLQGSENVDPLGRSCRIDIDAVTKLNAAHQALETEVDAFNTDDMTRLRSHVKTLTVKQGDDQKDLTPADTTTIEITLMTLTKLDHLMFQLRKRSHELSLLTLRVRWESSFAEASQWLAAADREVGDFLANGARFNADVDGDLDNAQLLEQKRNTMQTNTAAQQHTELVIRKLLDLEHQIADYDEGLFTDTQNLYQDMDDSSSSELPSYLEERQTALEEQLETLTKRMQFTRHVVEQQLMMREFSGQIRQLLITGGDLMLKLDDIATGKETLNDSLHNEIEFYHSVLVAVVTSTSSQILFPDASGLKDEKTNVQVNNRLRQDIEVKKGKIITLGEALESRYHFIRHLVDLRGKIHDLVDDILQTSVAAHDATAKVSLDCLQPFRKDCKILEEDLKQANHRRERLCAQLASWNTDMARFDSRLESLIGNGHELEATDEEFVPVVEARNTLQRALNDYSHTLDYLKDLWKAGQHRILWDTATDKYATSLSNLRKKLSDFIESKACWAIVAGPNGLLRRGDYEQLHNMHIRLQTTFNDHEQRHFAEIERVQEQLRESFITSNQLLAGDVSTFPKHFEETLGSLNDANETMRSILQYASEILSEGQKFADFSDVALDFVTATDNLVRQCEKASRSLSFDRLYVEELVSLEQSITAFISKHAEFPTMPTLGGTSDRATASVETWFTQAHDYVHQRLDTLRRSNEKLKAQRIKYSSLLTAKKAFDDAQNDLGVIAATLNHYSALPDLFVVDANATVESASQEIAGLQQQLNSVMEMRQIHFDPLHMKLSSLETLDSQIRQLFRIDSLTESFHHAQQARSRAEHQLRSHLIHLEYIQSCCLMRNKVEALQTDHKNSLTSVLDGLESSKTAKVPIGFKDYGDLGRILPAYLDIVQDHRSRLQVIRNDILQMDQAFNLDVRRMESRHALDTMVSEMEASINDSEDALRVHKETLEAWTLHINWRSDCDALSEGMDQTSNDFMELVAVARWSENLDIDKVRAQYHTHQQHADVLRARYKDCLDRGTNPHGSDTLRSDASTSELVDETTGLKKSKEKLQAMQEYCEAVIRQSSVVLAMSSEAESILRAADHHQNRLDSEENKDLLSGEQQWLIQRVETWRNQISTISCPVPPNCASLDYLASDNEVTNRLVQEHLSTLAGKISTRIEALSSYFSAQYAQHEHETARKAFSQRVKSASEFISSQKDKLIYLRNAHIINDLQSKMQTAGTIGESLRGYKETLSTLASFDEGKALIGDTAEASMIAEVDAVFQQWTDTKDDAEMTSLTLQLMHEMSQVYDDYTELRFQAGSTGEVKSKLKHARGEIDLFQGNLSSLNTRAEKLADVSLLRLSATARELLDDLGHQVDAAEQDIAAKTRCEMVLVELEEWLQRFSKDMTTYTIGLESGSSTFTASLRQDPIHAQSQLQQQWETHLVELANHQQRAEVLKDSILKLNEVHKSMLAPRLEEIGHRLTAFKAEIDKIESFARSLKECNRVWQDWKELDLRQQSLLKELDAQFSEMDFNTILRIEERLKDQIYDMEDRYTWLRDNWIATIQTTNLPREQVSNIQAHQEERMALYLNISTHISERIAELSCLRQSKETASRYNEALKALLTSARNTLVLAKQDYSNILTAIDECASKGVAYIPTELCRNTYSKRASESDEQKKFLGNLVQSPDNRVQDIALGATSEIRTSIDDVFEDQDLALAQIRNVSSCLESIARQAHLQNHIDDHLSATALSISLLKSKLEDRPALQDDSAELQRLGIQLQNVRHQLDSAGEWDSRPPKSAQATLHRYTAGLKLRQTQLMGTWEELQAEYATIDSSQRMAQIRRDRGILIERATEVLDRHRNQLLVLQEEVARDISLLALKDSQAPKTTKITQVGHRSKLTSFRQELSKLQQGFEREYRAVIVELQSTSPDVEYDTEQSKSYSRVAQQLIELQQTFVQQHTAFAFLEKAAKYLDSAMETTTLYAILDSSIEHSSIKLSQLRDSAGDRKDIRLRHQEMTSKFRVYGRKIDKSLREMQTLILQGHLDKAYQQHHIELVRRWAELQKQLTTRSSTIEDTLRRLASPKASPVTPRKTGILTSLPERHRTPGTSSFLKGSSPVSHRKKFTVPENKVFASRTRARAELRSSSSFNSLTLESHQLPGTHAKSIRGGQVHLFTSYSDIEAAHADIATRQYGLESCGSEESLLHASVSGGTPRSQYIPDPRNVLDQHVARVLNDTKHRMTVRAVPGEVGKYWFGDVEPKLVYCRILRSHRVMVRVGGGWVELSRFLADHALLENRILTRRTALNPAFHTLGSPQSREPSPEPSFTEGYLRTSSHKSPTPTQSRSYSQQLASGHTPPIPSNSRSPTKVVKPNPLSYNSQPAPSASTSSSRFSASDSSPRPATPNQKYRLFSRAGYKQGDTFHHINSDGQELIVRMTKAKNDDRTSPRKPLARK